MKDRITFIKESDAVKRTDAVHQSFHSLSLDMGVKMLGPGLLSSAGRDQLLALTPSPTSEYKGINKILETVSVWKLVLTRYVIINETLNSNKYFIVRNFSINNNQKTSAIRSIYRAVDILICLSNGINTLTGITIHTKLTKPTVYRLLKTLEELLMVTQDPITHQYYLGPLINQLASNPESNHHYLISCALSELNQLWESSGETVELNIMVGLQYQRIYEIQSRFELKVVAGPDPVGPVFVGATAKVLLSQLDDAELKIALENIKIKHVTEHSVTDRKELIAQAKVIRKQGYAISHGERIDGALCISAPIRNYFWPVALSIVGPELRFNPLADKYLKEVIASSSRVSENIKKFFREKGVTER